MIFFLGIFCMEDDHGNYVLIKFSVVVFLQVFVIDKALVIRIHPFVYRRGDVWPTKVGRQTLDRQTIDRSTFCPQTFSRQDIWPTRHLADKAFGQGIWAVQLYKTTS